MLAIARQADMAPEELHAQCVLLLGAGHETTRNLTGNGIYTLLRHPEARAEVRRSDLAVRAAVEQVLRYESPVQAYTRGAAEDIDFEGVRIPAGSSVFFMIAAAHRDPRHTCGFSVRYSFRSDHWRRGGEVACPIDTRPNLTEAATSSRHSPTRATHEAGLSRQRATAVGLSER